jgi:galactokinase
VSRASSLTDRFTSLTGRGPDGVWSAPGRVNLIGEHTDYNDGYVLPFAIDRSTVAAVALRDDGRVRGWSEQRGAATELAVGDIGPGSVEGWAAYAYGVVWALRQAGVDVPGTDLVVSSDVPAGAGLSSSAALTVAVTVALAELLGVDVDVPVIAQRAETDVAGTPCGLMDQSVAVLARGSAAVLIDMRDRTAEVLPLPLRLMGLAAVVIDTRIKHALNEGGYAERRRECEQAAAALGVRSLRDAGLASLDAADVALTPRLLARARHVVTENARVLEVAALLREGRVGEVGPALLASHTSLRDDFEVSCPQLDVAVQAAMAGGALGARLTGGGFGGSALALVPTTVVPELQAAVSSAFARRGWAAPGIFVVVPSGGARRVQ